MTHPRPRLVATDLDGTFFDVDGMAHPDNLAAAHDLVAAGIEFVVATGRPRRNLRQLDGLSELDPIVIASNGASIGRLTAPRPEIIHPIEPELVHDFADQLPAALQPSFAVEFPNGWGRDVDFPGLRSVDTLTAPLPELLEAAPVLKVMVHSRRAHTERLAGYAEQAAGDGLTSTFSWVADHGTVEISGAGVNKGTALAEIIAELGLEPKDCAAFGDMPNDLEMLRLVGLPYAMAGSHESLLDHGFTVIGHHYDGAVGQQLRRWIG